MTATGLTIERLDVANLSPHPRNPRRGDIAAIAESLQVNGQYRPIVVAADHVILAGNHTYQAAVALGWTHIDTVVLPIDSDSKAAIRIMLADNRTADMGGYDEHDLLDLIRETESTAGLDGTGWTVASLRDLQQFVKDLDEPAEKFQMYTTATSIPQYEPQGPCPPLSSLYNAGRQSALTKAIDAADIPKDVARFLRLAAYRHVVFDYRKIANYYAHAPAHIQQLMEASALVIIDVNDAIANGYAVLSRFLDEHEDDGEPE